MLQSLLHTSIGLLGLLLLYLALFLRETDEGALQNKLEDLWVRIDDASQKALTKQAAFTQQIAVFIGTGFDWLFGTKLFSAEAICVSLCLSATAMWLTVAGFANSGLPVKWAVAMAAITFCLGIAARRFWYVGLLSAPAAILLVHTHNRSNGIEYGVADAWTATAILIVAVIFDIGFIVITRWFLRQISGLKRRTTMACLLLLNGLIGVLLCAVPVVLLFVVWSNFAWPVIAEILAFVAYSNLLDILLGFTSLIVSLLALLHLVIWPVIERPIYSAQRFGVVRLPKLLAGVGVCALLFAWPHNAVVHGITALVKGK